jgi:hypothetical protein
MLVLRTTYSVIHVLQLAWQALRQEQPNNNAHVCVQTCPLHDPNILLQPINV